jgi:hypothetical protein
MTAALYGQKPPMANACLAPGGMADLRHRLPRPAVRRRRGCRVAGARDGAPQRRAGPTRGGDAGSDSTSGRGGVPRPRRARPDQDPGPRQSDRVPQHLGCASCTRPSRPRREARDGARQVVPNSPAARARRPRPRAQAVGEGGSTCLTPSFELGSGRSAVSGSETALLRLQVDVARRMSGHALGAGQHGAGQGGAGPWHICGQPARCEVVRQEGAPGFLRQVA